MEDDGDAKRYLIVFPRFQTPLRLVHMTDVDMAMRHRDKDTAHERF
jgi:hypothetical protein